MSWAQARDSSGFGVRLAETSASESLMFSFDCVVAGGRAVDATIIASPSPVKNAAGARDHTMRQALGAASGVSG